MRSPALGSRNSAHASIFTPLGHIFRRLACALFGHSVDNRAFARYRGALRKCPCGAPFLKGDRSETRVSHTLSCFFFHHVYLKMGARDGHTEFVCEICGHPLLFEIGRSTYASRDAFHKPVRYLCILYGHHLHTVTERNGLTEYACDCGHSFLRREKSRTRFRHPPVCVFKGHYISFVERRGNYDEYLCRNCGHTFSFIATG